MSPPLSWRRCCTLRHHAQGCPRDHKVAPNRCVWEHFPSSERGFGTLHVEVSSWPPQWKWRLPEADTPRKSHQRRLPLLEHTVSVERSPFCSTHSTRSWWPRWKLWFWSHLGTNHRKSTKSSCNHGQASKCQSKLLHRPSIPSHGPLFILRFRRSRVHWLYNFDGPLYVRSRTWSSSTTSLSHVLPSPSCVLFSLQNPRTSCWSSWSQLEVCRWTALPLSRVCPIWTVHISPVPPLRQDKCSQDHQSPFQDVHCQEELAVLLLWLLALRRGPGSFCWVVEEKQKVSRTNVVQPDIDSRDIQISQVWKRACRRTQQRKGRRNSSGKTKKEAIVWGAMQKEKLNSHRHQTWGRATGEGSTRQRATWEWSTWERTTRCCTAWKRKAT